MKENLGKWIAVIVLVLLLVIIIRGYILQLQESQEDNEIKKIILQDRLSR